MNRNNETPLRSCPFLYGYYTHKHFYQLLVTLEILRKYQQIYVFIFLLLVRSLLFL